MFYHIQLLRFLSAFAVLAAHLILFGNAKYGLGMPQLDPIAAGLMIGVDIFFIISGFIMMETARKGGGAGACTPRQIADFMYRRVTRIYPLWWLLCLALLPVFLFRPGWINSGVEAPTSFLHSFFLIPHEGVPLIMVGWTLEFEMVFYLLFGATLWLARSAQFAVLSAFILGCVGLGLMTDWDDSYPLAGILLSGLMLYFPIGMGLCLIKRYLPTSAGALAVAVALCGMSLLYLAHDDIGTGLARFIHFAPTAALVFLIFLMLDMGRKAAYPGLYNWGGHISYGLYIVHILVISAMGRVHDALGLDMPFVLIAAMGAASIAAAAILYHGFERPVLNFLRRVKGTRPFSKGRLSPE